MKNPRRKFTSEFKSKIVLEAISERKKVSELALEFDLHHKQISDWKKKFLANAYMIFELDDADFNKPITQGELTKTK